MTTGRPTSGDRWPLVARTAEVAMLRDPARSTVMIGAAGVGKTRLLHQVASDHERDGGRTVRVTGSAVLRSIPLGAFASVVPIEPVESGSRARLLQAALDHIRGMQPPPLVVVDDAHLLDDLSAAVIGQLHRCGLRVIASVRSGEPCSPEIGALWAGESGLRLDLAPFTSAELGAVIGAALDGELDAGTRERLWRLTAGNILFAREVVLSGLETDTLRVREGVWHWHGPLVVSPRLSDVIAARLVDVASGARRVLELLAVGGPLGLHELRLLAAPDGVHAAEQAGLVQLVRSERRSEIRPAHPLYAEVARDAIGEIGRSALARDVAKVLLESGGRRRDDIMRVATTFMVADDLGVPQALVLHAASRGRVIGDLALALRLGEFAVRIEPSPTALLSVAEAEYWLGDRRRVLHIVEGLDFDALTADDAMLAAMLASSSHFWSGGDLDRMDQWIDRGVARLDDRRALELRSHRVEMLMFAGRSRQAVDHGRQLADTVELEPSARLRALSGLLPALAVRGELGEVRERLPTAFALIAELTDSAANASGGIMIGAFVAAMFDGTLTSLDPLLATLHHKSAEHVADPFEGVWAFLRGRSLLAQGRVADALTMLADANAVLADGDPGQVRPWCLAALCQARAMAGDVAGARRACAELDQVWKPAHQVLRSEVELARAWTLAVGGDLSAAARAGYALGCDLLVQGELATAGMALHEATRLGLPVEAVVAPLDRAAAAEGPVIRALAHHARAASQRDVDGLVAAAAELEAAGWLLHAAEILNQASRLAGEIGRPASRRHAASSRDRLLAQCVGVATPELFFGPEGAGLTPLTAREREVALLAGRGATKRDIAARLGLSVRTVGNHINHIYAKLGIENREQLGDLLAGYPYAGG